MKKVPIVMLTTAILMALITLGHAQQVVTKDKIIGTWKLLSFYDENVDTGARTNVFGEHPRGYQILTADGRIALLYVAASREAPKSLPQTSKQLPSSKQCSPTSAGTRSTRRRPKGGQR